MLWSPLLFLFWDQRHSNMCLCLCLTLYTLWSMYLTHGGIDKDSGEHPTGIPRLSRSRQYYAWFETAFSKIHAVFGKVDSHNSLPCRTERKAKCRSSNNEWCTQVFFKFRIPRCLLTVLPRIYRFHECLIHTRARAHARSQKSSSQTIVRR